MPPRQNSSIRHICRDDFGDRQSAAARYTRRRQQSLTTASLSARHPQFHLQLHPKVRPMPDLRLTFAIGDYLHMRELTLGRVKPEGIELTVLTLPLETIAYRFLAA